MNQETNYVVDDGLSEMHKQIHDLRLKIQNLSLSIKQNKRNRRNHAISSDESDVDEDDIFPLKTVKQLSAFERRLKKNKIFRKRLVIFKKFIKIYYFFTLIYIMFYIRLSRCRKSEASLEVKITKKLVNTR